MVSDIYVCSLARLNETVERSGARYVVSAINPWSIPETPARVSDANHLRLAINDIDAPHANLVHPESHHIETLVAFARQWSQDGPIVAMSLVLRCWITWPPPRRIGSRRDRASDRDPTACAR